METSFELITLFLTSRIFMRFSSSNNRLLKLQQKSFVDLEYDFIVQKSDHYFSENERTELARSLLSFRNFKRFSGASNKLPPKPQIPQTSILSRQRKIRSSWSFFLSIRNLQHLLLPLSYKLCYCFRFGSLIFLIEKTYQV